MPPAPKDAQTNRRTPDLTGIQTHESPLSVPRNEFYISPVCPPVLPKLNEWAKVEKNHKSSTQIVNQFQE